MRLADPRSSPAIRAALKGHEPTEEQWHAISHPLEPLFLIAGAGSGKTAVMAARIVWALETQPLVPPQILGLTFTNKAAGELHGRVQSALSDLEGYRGEDVNVQTYNAFAAGVVRDHGLLVGVEPEAGLLSEAQQWQLVLSCLDDLPPFEALEIRSSYVVTGALALARALADHLVGVNDVEAAADHILSLRGADEKLVTTAAKRKELCRLVEAYRLAKERRARIDFGDQVTRAVEVMTQHADVRDAYRKRFPFVLLDEYQDTNIAQRQLLQALIGEGGAVTAVGDARQAIFAWRGATMYNLIGFPEHFPRSGGEPYGPVSLSENFRSGSRILEVANRVVDRIPIERRPGDPLKPQGENGTGSVAIGLFSDERSEAAWIASRCESLHGIVTAPGRDPVQWKDIAILVRRKAAMDEILHALEDREIPTEVVGLGGLLKTPEVTEIVAWLRALETRPSANRWLGRILLGPRWRVHYRDLSLLAHWAAAQNWEYRVRMAGGDEELAREQEPGDVAFALAEALGHVDEIPDLGAEAKRRLRSFAAKLDTVRSKSNAPLLELVQEVVRHSGIEDALESSVSRSAPAARQNVSNFLDQVAGFAPVEGEATLRSFIAYLDAAEAAEETLEASQPAEQDSVKLMTVHSAKGLEFECVFVPSVAAARSKSGDYKWSLFPNDRASNPLTSYSELPYEVRKDREHLPSFGGKLNEFSKAVKERAIEDERRLFYVALTRAKQRLAVTASWWYGRDKNPRGPSQFWEELAELEPEGLLEIAARDDQAEANPLFEHMEARREWPPTPRAGIDDPLFPEGWGAVADRVVAGEVSLDELTARLDGPERDRVTDLIGAHGRDLAVIASAAGPRPAPAALPEIVSATSLVRYQGGELSAWELSRPLPTRPTHERRLGTEVHKLIEETSRGISVYPEEHELDAPSKVSEPGVLEPYLQRWRERFGNRTPARLPSGELMVELPFALRWGDRIVRGRIDAVYETDDGGLEIVDFKTGKRFERDADDQLTIYAAALRALGVTADGPPVKLTYAFLAD